MSEKHDNSITEANLKPTSNSSINIYNSSSGLWEHPDQDIQLTHPFHLTTTNHSCEKTGLTNSLVGEEISYTKIETVEDFYKHAQYDLSASHFENNHRGSKYFIESDVISIDVDNDDRQNKKYWDDENNWFTLEDFTTMMEPYEYILKTSRNHEKPKEWKKKNGELIAVRKPRPKFHAFVPIGKALSDVEKYRELLEILKFFVKDGNEHDRIDTICGAYSQLFGHGNTKVYYNKGGERIDDLLIQGDVRDAYDEYIGNNNDRSKYRPYGQIGQSKITSTSVSEDLRNYKNGWDYRNIMPRLDFEEIFGYLKPYTGYGDGGYYMGWCALHDDNEPSLMVYPHGGYNCKGCKQKSFNAMDYIAKKTNRSKEEVRKQLCKEFNLDHNEYRMAENDVELKGFVPCTNDNHIHISFDDYRRLKKLNSKYARCVIGTTVCVMNWTKTAYHQQHKADSYKAIEYMTSTDFQKQFADDFVRTMTKEKIDKDGNQVWKSSRSIFGKLWWTWDNKRKYDRSTFFPNDEREIYDDGEKVHDAFDDFGTGTWANGWSGSDGRRGLKRFVDPDKLKQFMNIDDAQAACSKYLHHIKHRICGNYTGKKKQLIYEYILKWMAHVLTKHQDDRCTVALVLMSDLEGTGKGTFVQFFGEFFGSHFLHVGESERLTSRFNTLMKDKLLVFADESLFAGDKNMISKVKIMQTEPTFTVEQKGIDASIVNNYRRFIYASNSEHAIAKSFQGRRFMVIDVPNKRMDRAMFKEVEKQWKAGGKEGFYYYLTSDEVQAEVDEFNFEKMIETKGGVDQMLLTEPLLAWWHDILEEGGHRQQGLNDSGRWTADWEIYTWDNKDQNRFVEETDKIMESFYHYMNTRGGSKYSGGKKDLSAKLHKLSERGIISFDRSKRCYKTDKRIWIFESIFASRKRWDAHFNNGEASFGL